MPKIPQLVNGRYSQEVNPGNLALKSKFLTLECLLRVYRKERVRGESSVTARFLA